MSKTIVIKTQAEMDAAFRLISKTKRNDRTGCWEFHGRRDKSGYGRISINGRQTGAHQAAFALFNGKPFQGKDVSHDCDNPSCVYPGHLSLLTRSENIRDAVNRRRIKRGTNSPNSVLTSIEVSAAKKLRSRGWSNPQIGKKFGVATETVRRHLAREFKEFFK